MQSSSIESNLRNIILKTKKPIVIRNKIKSNIIHWDLCHWKKIINNESLTFRCGKNIYTREPQWECRCSTKIAKFQDFLKHSRLNSLDWWYFDYKYLRTWFSNNTELRENIPWAELGFPEITYKDTTMWIGSKGAHTPCHIDTYGSNIVLQAFGSKLWLLFPPEENLRPTRVPYEESSIYSKFNFFSPDLTNFKDINHCYKVILNPGDVLIVPNKWWHYVENLDFAISINTWLPLETDVREHINESITAILVKGIINTQEYNYKHLILNPNMFEEMINVSDALSVLKIKLKELQSTNKKLIKSENEDIESSDYITKLEELTETEFHDFIQHQSQRFPKIKEEASVPDNYVDITDFLEVITDPEVVSLIAKKMCEKISM